MLRGALCAQTPQQQVCRQKLDDIVCTSDLMKNKLDRTGNKQFTTTAFTTVDAKSSHLGC